MSSPFSSALAQLDGSLQNVHVQIDCLEAALEVNDDRLIHSLTDARRHAARLRDLVRAERPDARWESRTSLAQLVHELEMEIAAKARRDQQRRDKLAGLADELEAGTIKHRFDTRRTALSDLRAEAVRELRSEAGVAANVKELPGPEVRGWLHWACSLAEPNDSAILTELRGSFPQLEHFAGEMEESYWTPTRRDSERPSTTVVSEAAPETMSQPELPRPSDSASPSQADQSVPAEFYKISHTARYDPTLSSSVTATSEAVTDQALIETIASSPHAKLCENCGGTFPAQFQLCPFDGTPLKLLAQPGSPAVGKATTKVRESGEREAAESVAVVRSATAHGGDTASKPESSPAESIGNGEMPEPADVELERLKTILQQNSGDGEFQLLDRTIPRKKMMIAIGVAAAAVLLSGVLGFAYRKANVSVGKLRSTVLAAGANVAGIERTAVPDADIQRDLERQMAQLKDSSIQVDVDEGIVTLAGRSSSEWEALHAESLASQTAGVKRVKNEVEVKPDDSAASGKKSNGKTKKK